MMTQKLGNGFEFIKKACFICGSFNHLIQDCDFHDNKMVEKAVLNNKGRVTGQREIRPVWNNAQRVNHQNKLTHPHPKRNFVPTAVATKSGQVPVNAAKQSSPRAAASISTAKTVNTATHKPKVNDALPTTYSYFKAHSLVIRTFNQKSAAKTNNFNEKVNIVRFNNVTTVGPKEIVSTTEGNKDNVVKSPACWIWRPKGNVIDHFSKDSGSYTSKRFDYVDPQGRLKFSWVLFLATKDETSEILKTFITGIEHQINHKVKIIRCDNGTEYKNNDMNQFCGMKGIKREFSVARNLQQNRIAERKNRTLIEAARTMLADSLLPTSFWAEAVSTACYVQNKADEGFFVGYSINSKAFRVFNTRTRKVEENLHITFLENKPNVAGSGPDWLFDIDLLTNSMNYEPVTAGNQTNKNAGNKDNGTQQYILLPLLYNSPQSSEDAVADDAGKKTNEEPANEGERNGQEKEGGASNKEDDQNVQDFRAALDNLLVQQKKGYANSTNRDSTVSPSVSAAGQSFTNADDLPTDPLMPDLEDTGIFSGAYDDEDVGAMVKQKYDEIFINQDKYVAGILKKFDFVTMKTTSTPIETNKALLKDEEAEDVDVHLYRSMIGSLMYLTASRPDIMFAVCACARDLPFDLEAFSDSDYAGASLDRKSTTGGCQFLSKRQVLWIQNQMLDYGFNFMNTKIYIDNESTICIVKNPVFHSKTKHIEIRHHFIRDSYEKKLIQVIKIYTDHNVADLLTKAFDVSRLDEREYETVYKEWEDRMERVVTTAFSLEAEQDSEAQIRFEAASKQSNDPPLSRVNTLRSGEDSMKLKELMELCIKLSERIFDIKTDRVNW
ncbi:ribonuclease H-like domain-containing protein [Tanacetum coccineum]